MKIQSINMVTIEKKDFAELTQTLSSIHWNIRNIENKCKKEELSMGQIKGFLYEIHNLLDKIIFEEE